MQSLAYSPVRYELVWRRWWVFKYVGTCRLCALDICLNAMNSQGYILMSMKRIE